MHMPKLEANMKESEAPQQQLHVVSPKPSPHPCPHCGKKLTELSYHTDRHCWERGTARITQGELILEDEHEDGTGKIEFTCPYCESTVCDDEDAAQRFLLTGEPEDEALFD